MVEVAVLGAVGIYASVAGGPTFESRRWLNRALTPAPSPTSSATATPAVDAEPVELDPCELIRTQNINMTLGTRLLPTRRSAGPGGNVGIWSDDEGWWTSCLYEDYPRRTESLEVLVITGPGLDEFEPDEEGQRTVPDLGEEAWVTTGESESEPSLTVDVRTPSAFLSLSQYAKAGPNDMERRLTELARELVERLPAKPRVTPMRVGATCAAIPLDGAKEFLSIDQVGGRQLLMPGSDTSCTFTGEYGAMLEVTVFVEGSVAAERAFFRGEGKRIAGVGDEAYFYFDETSAGAIFFVRKGDLVLGVTYYTMDGDQLSDESGPVADEIALLKSLVPDGDVIAG